jgi:hypothetical protein
LKLITFRPRQVIKIKTLVLKVFLRKIKIQDKR